MDLEELARLINQKWPHPEQQTRTTAVKPFVLTVLWPDAGDVRLDTRMPDTYNAQWTIWALDRLADLKAKSSLFPGDLCGFICGKYIEGAGPCGAYASTRASAVASALMIALRGAVNE